MSNHWIFLVNAPIGAAVLLASLRVLPASPATPRGGRLDGAGAVLVTAAVMLAVYAVVGAGQAGWTSARTLGTLAGAVVLLTAFAAVEARVSVPLMPLRLLRLRSLSTASVIGVLWAAAMFACFFLTTLYLQLVLGYSPLLTGLAFLPMNLIMASLSAGVAARLVTRFGVRPPLVGGLAMAAVGLALMGRAPVGGHFLTDVLPGGILLGIGAGTALAPLLLAAISDVRPDEAGLASGMVNTGIPMPGPAHPRPLALAVSPRLPAGAGREGLGALPFPGRGARAPGVACGGPEEWRPPPITRYPCLAKLSTSPDTGRGVRGPRCPA